MMLMKATEIMPMKQKIHGNKIFVKAEEFTPYAFGGNKLRKAKIFFEDIEATNSDCVVTYGSSRSNHCRVVANLAAERKIKCVIVSPIEENKETYNSLLMEFLGAEIVMSKLADVKRSIENTLSNLVNLGYNPYFIPGGGHGNIGTQAYVEAYREIKVFELTNDIDFDYIFTTSGTGTTQAGLVCGKLIHRDDTQIIGISNARKNPDGELIVLDSVNSYLRSIEEPNVTLEEINFVDDYIVDGYGSYNPQIKEVIKDVFINEGIPLDTTYTGKGFWGMKEYILDHEITGKEILFIHTGGLPLFFDGLD